MLIEICANSFTSAQNAQLAGASRIELCQDLELGGTTPSAACIQMVSEQLSIKTNVLIRPRAGDFCYTKSEFEIIKREIEFCKLHNINGVVIGILLKDGHIDVNRVRELVHLARPMEITFHRAFDFVPNPFFALEQLIKLNIDTVLTSGQRQSAIEGKQVVKELVKKANGRINILAGAGINISNVEELVHFTNIQQIHLSAKKTIKSTFNPPIGLSLNKGEVSELDYLESDEQKIIEIVELFNP